MSEPEWIAVARIESNGRPSGTKVFLMDGRILEGVSEVEWSIGVNRLPEVRVTLKGPVHLTGDASMVSVEVDR